MRLDKTCLDKNDPVDLQKDVKHLFVTKINMANIDDAICSYSKEDVEIIEDKHGKFYHKNIIFEISEDDVFRTNNLVFALPKYTTLSTVERIALSYGLPTILFDHQDELDTDEISFRSIFHTLTLLSLKDLGIIKNSFSLSKQIKYGNNIFETYYRSIQGKGSIKAKQKNMRWLNESDTMQLKSKLFNASSYQKHKNAMRYRPTMLAETIISKMYDLFKTLKFKKTNIKPKSLDFTVTTDQLSQIKLRDTLLLLGECSGFIDGFVINPKIKDCQFSRKYSVFTSISSDSRKILGFTGYDIGAALQTICLQLVDNHNKYPLHQLYVSNKVNFRKRIEEETKKSPEIVKKILNISYNIKKLPKRYISHQILYDYYHETQQIKDEVINSAELTIIQRAKQFAKPKWKREWDEDNAKPIFLEDGKSESSIFFFIWTQWERQIRESMINCFSNPGECQEVHDAVYSKEIIDPKSIEDRVQKETGFTVKISVEEAK